MTNKKRRLVLYMILTMVTLLILMFFSGIQQGKARQKVTQKVDYSYLNFAEKNSNVKDGVIVLAYHRILKNNATVSFAQKISKNPQLQEYNVSQDEFIRQMDWLKRIISVFGQCHNLLNILKIIRFVVDTLSLLLMILIQRCQETLLKNWPN